MESTTEFVTEGHLQRCSWHLASRMLLCLTLILSFHYAHAQEVVYERVTNTSQLIVGAKYIITDSSGDMAMSYQKTNNRHAVSVASNREDKIIKDITIATSTNDQTHAYEFTLGGQTGAWTFYDELNQGYLYAAGGTSKGNNYLRTSKNPNTEEATITKGLTITFAPNKSVINKILQYYPNNKLFACYNTTYGGIALYLKKVGSMSISEHGYTTYVSHKYNYEMPKGCTGFVVKRAGERLLLVEQYKEGDVVPADTPLLVQGAEGIYSVYESANPVLYDADAENLLHGDFDADGNVNYDIANKDKYEYFKLGLKGGLNFGFYWGSQDGAPFKMSRTDRAYLVLPREETGQVKGLVLDDAMVETGIVSHAGQTSTSGKVYDLSGRICRGVLAPGIYIRDGRKVLISK